MNRSSRLIETLVYLKEDWEEVSERTREKEREKSDEESEQVGCGREVLSLQTDAEKSSRTR